MRRPSGDSAIPRMNRPLGGSWVTLVWSNTIVPRVVETTPRIVFNSVDLPAPLGPSTATSSPGAMLKLTSKRTGRRP